MANSKVKASRVLFARIGSMTFYSGPQPGDERPKGGGASNAKNLGHEVFNFAQFNGQLFGTARAKRGHVDLTRIDPSTKDAKTLDGVLIIFVARQHIVGWYSHATVHADTAQLPASVVKEMRTRLNQSKLKAFKVGGYRFETKAGDAVLLPTSERRFRVPGNVKGGFGQSNVRYSYRKRGRSEKSPWMPKAVQYVMNYDKANLLIDPEVEADAAQVANVAQERAAGFQSNPEIRRLIEQYAMKQAQSALERRGYSEFENTSATKPYDFICKRKGGKFFVEVKGTQTAGNAIVLTKNEVEHVKVNGGNCILVVVHSVAVLGKTVAKNGIAEVTEKWDLTRGYLSAIQYLWKW